MYHLPIPTMYKNKGQGNKEKWKVSNLNTYISLPNNYSTTIVQKQERMDFKPRKEHYFIRKFYVHN